MAQLHKHFKKRALDGLEWNSAARAGHLGGCCEKKNSDPALKHKIWLLASFTEGDRVQAPRELTLPFLRL